MKDLVLKAKEITWSNENAIELFAGGYRAIIIPEVGANIIALENTILDASILRTPSDNISLRKKPEIYGLPILFPPNRVSGGKFIYNDIIYHLPINEVERGNHIHGHIIHCPFIIEKLSITDNTAMAMLSFSSNDNKHFYSDFPNNFTITVIFILSKNGLEHIVTINNLSDFPLPLGLGYHTAFNLPFINDGNPNNYSLRTSVDKHWPLDSNFLPTTFINTDTKIRDIIRQIGVNPLDPLPTHWSSKPILFDGKEFHGAVLRDANSKIDLIYEVSSNFKFWVFWNDGGNNDFVCVEPQTWMINAPNINLDDNISGFSVIKAKDNLQCKSKIYLKKGKK